MSKITITPKGGKSRQYKASKFHSIHPIEGGSHVVIKLDSKELAFDVEESASALTTEVWENQHE